MAQTVTDLGKLVKTKYPGSYDDMPDDQVGVAVKKRYPGAYEDFESPLQGTRSFDTANQFAAATRSAVPSASAPRSYVPPATDWLNKSPIPGTEKFGGAPPGPAAPPLPTPTWETEDFDDMRARFVREGLLPYAKKPRFFQRQVVDRVGQGVQSIARGVERASPQVVAALSEEGRHQMQQMGAPPEQVGPPHVTKETFPEMAAGATGIAGGLMEAGTPFIPGMAISKPLTVIPALAAGIAADKAVGYGLNKAGVDPRISGAVAMGAGLLAGHGAGKAGGKFGEAIADQAGIYGEYGQKGTPIADARQKWENRPPPAPRPGPPSVQVVAQRPSGPGPTFRTAEESAAAFEAALSEADANDITRAREQARQQQLPGAAAPPAAPASGSARVFRAGGDKVPVPSLLDLKNQIARKLFSVDYGALDAGGPKLDDAGMVIGEKANDRATVDGMAVEEQRRLKAARIAQQNAPTIVSRDSLDAAEPQVPRRVADTENVFDRPDPGNSHTDIGPPPAFDDHRPQQSAESWRKMQAPTPPDTLGRKPDPPPPDPGLPGPPPVQGWSRDGLDTRSPWRRTADEAGEAQAPVSPWEREAQKPPHADPPEPASPATGGAQTKGKPSAVRRFLEEEEGYQRAPTRQDLREVKDAAAEKWDKFQARFRGHVTDRYASISDLMKKASSPIPAEDSAYVGARNYSGVGGKAEVRLERFGRILRAANRDKLLDPAVNYALYERYEELHDAKDIERFPAGQTIHQIRTDKRALEAALGPHNLAKVQRYGQQIRDYSNGLLKEALDAGVISREQYDGILKSNQKYVPLQRLAWLENEITSGRSGAGGDAFSVRGQDLYHHIKGEGSESDIVDPLQSIIKNTYKTVSLIARNKVARQIGELAARPEFRGTVDVMNPGQRPRPGMESVSALVDGKRIDYQVPGDVGRALKNMNSQQIDIVTKTASKMGSMLRAGATSMNAGFLASNIIRDYQTATAVSKVGFTPMDWSNGFWQAFAAKTGLWDDAVYQQFLDSGGAMSGYFGGARELSGKVADLTDNFAQRELIPSWKKGRMGALGKMGAGAATGALVAGPPGALVGAKVGLILHTVRHLGELTELAPRLGVFMKSMENGLPPEEAGFNARNATVDFSKAGNVMRAINLWVPFLNARLQGNINLFQALRPSQVGSRQILGSMRSPKQVAVWNGMKVTSMVGIPAVMTYLYNHRNKEIAEAYGTLSPEETRGNFVLMMGTHQDDQGRFTQALKIPKGDVKAFANPVESLLDYLGNTDPKALQQLAVEFGSDISPVDFEREGEMDLSQPLNQLLPPTVKGAVEGYTNKNFYTGRQIVSDFYHSAEMRKAHPEKQYTDRSSNIAKVIGDKLGVAPAKVDNFAATQFGGLGRQLTAMSGSQKTPVGMGPGMEQVKQRYIGARSSQDEKAQKALREIEATHADEGMDRARSAEEMADKLDAMKSDGERANFIQSMIAQGRMDGPMAKALRSSIEGRRQGLTGIERSLKSRPLDVRAEYIARELKQAKDDDARGAIIARYAEKKIITGEVARRIAKIMAAGQ